MIRVSAIAITVIGAVAAAPAFAQEVQVQMPPAPPSPDQQALGAPAPSCGGPCPAPPACQSTPEPPVAAHRGFMAMAYLGVSGFKGQSGINDAFGTDLKIGPSMRAGGMVGLYIAAHISLDVELAVDFLNIDGASSSGVRVVAAFSPLFHLWTVADQELVFGPKLGGWSSHLSFGGGDTSTAHGYLVGINLGDYFAVGTLLVGGLLTYEVARVTEVCGFSCDGDVSGLRSEKVLSLVASILY